MQLIQSGKAFVCDLNADQIREYRGTLTEPGKNSPYRDRSVEENLDLFQRMRARRISGRQPHVCGRRSTWPRLISICAIRSCIAFCARHIIAPATSGASIRPTISPTANRIPLKELPIQFVRWNSRITGRSTIGFSIASAFIIRSRSNSRGLNLTYTVLSKRKLLQLVQQKHVTGWDDPRMPTIAAYRRRGYTPEAIRTFCERIGVAKRNSTVDIAMLEHCLREDLNKRSPRVMAVLRPVKVVLENYPEGQVEELEAINNPEDPSKGTRKVPFSRVLYIEQDDFREEPPKGFFRLSPGKEVRLRYAYIVKCIGIVKDPSTGTITELRCTYDPETKSGSSQSSRKVKATIHWVSAAHALPAEVRLYDHLFTTEDPDDVPEGRDWMANINPKSLERLNSCYVEPYLAQTKPGERYQFERLGYFCLDGEALSADKLIFNRSVTLRDTWAKMAKTTKK